MFRKYGPLVLVVAVTVVWMVAVLGRTAVCEIPYGINGPKENCVYERTFP